MRPISGWAHLMASTVGIAAKTGVDSYGKPTYGTSTSYQAHISRKRRLVLTAGGQQIVSEQSIVLNTNAAAIQPDSQVTLSTGDIGSTETWALHPLILSVTRSFDQAGAHHVTVYV